VQRRCCHSVYISKDYVMSLQCMWLRCVQIDLIKRKINRFTASCKSVNAQKLSYVFSMYVCMMYMSCNVCTETLLSFCVYEQRLYHVFVMYVIAMHVNQSDKAKNQLIYYIMQVYRCAKGESCLRSVYVCDVYELQCMCKDVAVILCIWAKTVLCLCNVCDCKSIW